MKNFFTVAVAVMLLIVCAGITTAAVTGTIPEVARSQSDLRDFMRAVSNAGLESTLSGTGPFTVFAPTDSAFSRVPRGTMTRLMQPANKAALGSLLKYHVVRGNYTMADLRKMSSGTKLTTLDGKTLTVTHRGNDVYVDNALVGSEMRARNGTLFKLNSVLMPPTR